LPDFCNQRIHIGSYQVFQPGVGIEVTIPAPMGAERDMQINAVRVQSTTHRSPSLLNYLTACDG
jgi:hypothetical protein